MRIAIVHSYYDESSPSGENLVVDAQVEALRRAGHDVLLVDSRTSAERDARLYTARSAMRVARGTGPSPLAAISSFRPDIIHVHNLFPNFGREWVREASVPVVATLHNFRPMCSSGILFRDGAPCTLCPDGDTWAGLRHACYRGSRLATLPMNMVTARGLHADPVIADATRLIVLSSMAQQIYVKAGVAAERMSVRPNFLDDELDPGVQAGPAPDGDPVWLVVGRLSPEKGIVEFAELWPKGGATLTIIGDGPQWEDLVALGHPAVRALGPLSRPETIAMIGQATGLIIPSRAVEGSPLTYLEALACGTPVLALEGTSVAAAVLEDGTGQVTRWDADLPTVLADAGTAFPALRAHARVVFDREYTETAWVGNVIALYDQVLGR